MTHDHAVTPECFDAVLFDLDGVLTDTARIHSVCWKETFDDFLRRRAQETGEAFRPFDAEIDYRRYVDGKPRLDGVRGFLRSRGIELPEGEADAPAEEDSIVGLGTRKNRMVGRAIREHGVETFSGSIAWLHHVRAQGIKTGLVSSSKNCEDVLRAAGIEDDFDVRVDGRVAERLGLPGKPAPDTFLEAARALGVAPERAVVVEDAISGVQAGRRGGFGLVLGVARHGERDELRRSGADLVVGDLGELLERG